MNEFQQRKRPIFSISSFASPIIRPGSLPHAIRTTDASSNQDLEASKHTTSMVSSGIEYNPASDIHAKIETMYSILGYVLKFCTTVQNEALFHKSSMETSERSLNSVCENVLSTLNGISELEGQMINSSSEILTLTQRVEMLLKKDSSYQKNMDELNLMEKQVTEFANATLVENNGYIEENSLELKSCTLQETIEAKSAQIKTLDGEAEKYKQGICEIEQKLAIEIESNARSQALAVSEHEKRLNEQKRLFEEALSNLEDRCSSALDLSNEKDHMLERLDAEIGHLQCKAEKQAIDLQKETHQNRQLALEIENFKASEIQSEVSILPLTRQDRYNSLDRQYMADVKVIEALRGEIKIFKSEILSLSAENESVKARESQQASKISEIIKKNQIDFLAEKNGYLAIIDRLESDLKQKTDIQRKHEISPSSLKKSKSMEIFESLESSLNELSDHPFVDAHHTGSSFVAKASPEPSKVIHKKYSKSRKSNSPKKLN
ncbi:hypothetical protein MDAP_002871 [Mitosporidium daphniae]